MVVGQANNASAQLEMLGTLSSRGYEEFRGSNRFPASAVVFADPGLVKVEIVEPLE